MVQKAYKMQMITHNTTTIKGIVDDNITGGITQEELRGGGTLDPFNVITVGSKPRVNFTTTSIKDYLDLCGIDGLAITGSALWKGYYRQMADGGTFTGGSTDTLNTINKGVMYMNSINAPLNKVATLSATVIPTYDGTNLPCAFSNSATAPTIERDTIGWIGGPVKRNGTAIPAQGWTFDLGANYQVLGSDGLPYETECFLVSRSPKFTIPIHDMSLLTTSGALDGLAGTNFTLYLRKQTIGGGTPVADATAEHIKFTVTVGASYIENVTSPTSGLVSANLVIVPVYNVTNAVVIISTASAIT